MKHIILLIIILTTTQVHGQDVLKKQYDASDVNTIEIESEWSDVEVTFEDITEVRLSFDITINGKSVTKAIDVRDKIKNGTLLISTTLDHDQIEEMITLIYKDGHKVTMTKQEFRKNKSELADWEHMNTGYTSEGEIHITLPKHKAISIKTTYGDIDVVYDSPNKKHNLTLHSTYGHVDLTIPSSLSADLELASGYGEIYTDLDFTVAKNYKKRRDCNFGDHIIGILNNGTNGSIALEATYDNIYLRKI